MSNQDSSQYHYWAFISYSSKDKVWGQWLHRAIETYGIPAEFVEHHQTPSGHLAPKRFHPVFRDRDELPASADLGAVIKEALCASHYLIVICSPNAAQSYWVNAEIETFLALGRRDHILAIIVDGEPNAGDTRECFPPALRQFEPIAADARPEGDGKRNATLKLLAGMLGVSFDSLKHRDNQRRRRRLLVAGGTMGLLIALFVTLMGVAVYQGHLAEQRKQTVETAAQKVIDARQREDEATQKALAAKKNEEEAPQKAEEEKSKNEQHRYAADMLEIQEAWKQGNRSRLLTLLEGQRPERTGGADLRGFEWYYWWRQSHSELLSLKGQSRNVTSVCYSPDGKYLFSVGDLVEVWDAITGKELFTLKGQTGIKIICFSPDGKRLAAGGRDRNIKIRDAKSGRELLTITGYAGTVNSISFSPDGRRLASGMCEW